MSRKAAREIAVQMIFEYGYRCNSIDEIFEERLAPEFLSTVADEIESFREYDENQRGYLSEILNGVVEKEEEISELIKKYSIDWNINRISRIARAILSVAVYEILYYEDVPESVAINEAIELTKKYDTSETAAFVNGILGSVARGSAQ